MKNLIFLLAVLIIMSSLMYGQSITHPWWVVDRGGGKSTSGELTLKSSIGQAAIQSMAVDTFSLESGYIPGIRTLSGIYTSYEFHLADGWNMISVPLRVNDYQKTTLFPTATSPAFTFEGSYRTKDTLRNTYGYWLKFSGEQTSPIIGSSYSLDTIDVRAGWNMIGTLSYPALTSDVIPIPPVIIKSNFFGYDAGYYTEDTLKPGLGYWVKTSEAGKIVLKIGTSLMNKSTPVLVKNNRNLSGFKISNIAQDKELNKLLITDAEGKSTQLYFTAKPIELDLEKYELPPSPPSGIFDVRFKSNRTIEIAKQKIRDEKQTFPIVINGGKEPFTVSWELANDKYSYSLEVVHENKMSKRYDLNTNGKFTLNISDLVSMKLVMDVNNTIDLPTEFSLHQNYPNPFNPVTTFSFALKENSIVSLKVYNTLGQLITALIDNEEMIAGNHKVDFEASNLPSGVYFYRISVEELSRDKNTVTNKFVEQKKMLLLK